MQCISFKATSPSTASFPNSPQTLDFQGTPASSSSQLSPTVNLTREYTLALQTSSYSEIWSRIQDFNQENASVQVQDGILNENGVNSNNNHHLILSQLLQPNRECVEEALRYSKPNTLTRLVSTYFDHSENTINLCLLLFQSMYRARDVYAAIHELLDVLPNDPDSLTQLQCDRAFDVFLEFEQLDNPFPCPGADNFIEMRRCFSDLKQQLDHRLHKTRSRIRYLNRASAGAALCLIGTVIAVPISAALIATHTLVAAIVVALPGCYVPCGLKKKELSHVAQLDAASKGAYVLNEDLRTIDCLVASLYNTVEGDKLFIQFGLERGRDKYPIHEVVKQLRKNRVKFTEQLSELEVHLCLCFSAVNKARSMLLREIHHPQEAT